MLAAMRKLRYNESIRRECFALLDGDIGAARMAAKVAFAQRRTARSATLVAALTVAPGLLRQVYPAKRRLTDTVEHALGRLGPAGRAERP